MLPFRKNLTFTNLFNLSATLKTQSSVTSFIASFHLTTHWNPLQLENSVSPYNKWDTKRKMQSITCLGCKESKEDVFWVSFQLLCLNDTLLCGSMQMSSAHVWAGGHPALCLSPTDLDHPESNPLDLSQFLRERGSWRLPASLNWTALTLKCVSVY